MTPEDLYWLGLAKAGSEEKLAKALGYQGFTGFTNAQRQFDRWKAGGGMRFDTSLRLLEIIGMLRNPAPELKRKAGALRSTHRQGRLRGRQSVQEHRQGRGG